jgi:hypothetical protein
LSPSLRTGDWWHSLDAWQWWGQLLTAVLGTVALGAAVAAVGRSQYRAAVARMGIAAASFGAWAALLAPLGNGLGI